jgi:hypothetical protein
VQNVLRQKEIERKKAKKSKERKAGSKDPKEIQKVKLVGRDKLILSQCKEQKKTNHRGVSRRDLQSLSAPAVFTATDF